MADDIAQGFTYQPGRSTSNIFYNSNNGIPLSALPWCPTPPPADMPPYVLLTICSSSSGLIIYRVDPLSDYYIGNPYAQHQPRYHGPLVPPLSNHPRHDTNVVLTVHRHPGVMLPMFHIICAIRKNPITYDFDTFSSTTWQWTSHQGINLPQQREIVPNSGVSCGRFAYWLTENPRSVLRFDMDSNPEMISFLELPRVIPPEEQVRMQLGRTGDNLGIVIVSETASTVELYARPHPVAENEWRGPVVFNVEIETGANIACRARDGETLVCREMPRPIRFESFKIELLFWVSGEVVMLENSTTHPNLYKIQQFPPGNAPEDIIDGLPHVDVEYI